MEIGDLTKNGTEEGAVVFGGWPGVDMVVCPRPVCLAFNQSTSTLILLPNSVFTNNLFVDLHKFFGILRFLVELTQTKQ